MNVTLPQAMDRITELRAHVADQNAEIERLRADLAAALRLADQRAAENQRVVLRLERLRSAHSGLRRRLQRQRTRAANLSRHVRDLQASRWRKLGLRLGIAGLAPWEKAGP